MKFSVVFFLLLVVASASVINAEKDKEKEKEKKAKKVKKAKKKVKEAKEDYEKDLAEARADYEELKKKLKKKYDEEVEKHMDEYSAFKEKAEQMEALGKQVSYTFSKNLKPAVLWYNKYAPKDACSVKEAQAISKMMRELFNGILNSRGFDKVEWYLKATEMLIPGGRQLRGIDREEREEEERVLSSCHVWCRESATLCYAYCGGWCGRRRLGGKDQEEDKGKPIAIYEQSPHQFEAVTVDVARNLETGCQDLMRLIADNASGFQESCLEALKGVVCRATFDDISDLVKAKVDGKNLQGGDGEDGGD